MTLFEEAPDRVVVLLGHGEVAAPLIGRFEPVFIPIPVHPVAEANRLIRLNAGELVHALLTERNEPVDAREAVIRHEIFNVLLRPYTEFFFTLHLNPKPLAIEAVLIAQVVSGHGKIAAVSVFVRTAPGMVYAHRIVSRDRSVEERPFRLVTTLFPEQLEGTYALPKIEDRSFEVRKVDFRSNLVKVRPHSRKTRV